MVIMVADNCGWLWLTMIGAGDCGSWWLIILMVNDGLVWNELRCLCTVATIHKVIACVHPSITTVHSWDVHLWRASRAKKKYVQIKKFVSSIYASEVQSQLVSWYEAMFAKVSHPFYPNFEGVERLMLIIIPPAHPSSLRSSSTISRGNPHCWLTVAVPQRFTMLNRDSLWFTTEDSDQ